jgi:hypothetical protein
MHKIILNIINISIIKNIPLQNVIKGKSFGSKYINVPRNNNNKMPPLAAGAEAATTTTSQTGLWFTYQNLPHWQRNINQTLPFSFWFHHQ